MFSGLVLYGDAREVVGSVLALSPLYWLAVLGLTLAHISIRLIRWNYYLKVLGVKVDAKTSLISGYLLSVTLIACLKRVILSFQ